MHPTASRWRPLGRLTVACAALYGAPGVPPVAKAAEAEITLTGDGQVLSTSTRVAKGDYHFADANGGGAVQVSGDGIVVDFQGATLWGAKDGLPPNEYTGFGLVVRGAKDVTIKNLNLRGFKIGIYAKDCQSLSIEGCDVSDNYKQRLLSTPQAENGADWLFGHENDNNEWLRYGAGIYLEDCHGCTVRGNVGHRGQNGLCLVRCDRGRVYDNDMSFNSGWGLAMYRASHNEIAHNKFDWCIRGYSHGVYNRGQDSAGMFVFEQCSDNVFAYNSATHGGDGFFLFAGLETLEETGQGGCNRNLLYRNDFSHASNNGIEATFSDGNKFVENVMDQADHAIWAGYSYHTSIIGNRITRCNHGVSIEHGSGNTLDGNLFEGNGTAVNLWAGESSAFTGKPYGKHHHCRSEHYEIVRNRFRGNKLDLRLGNTSHVSVVGNDLAGAPEWLNANGACSEVTVDQCNLAGDARISDGVHVAFGHNHFDVNNERTIPRGAENSAEPVAIDFGRRRHVPPPDVHGAQDTALPAGALRGLEYIFVDEWGPYDFSQARIVPASIVAWQDAQVRLLGPSATPFEITDIKGDVRVAPLKGTLPATLSISSSDRRPREFSFVARLPERSEQLTAKGMLLFADWRLRFYRWPNNGPQKPPADWNAVLATEPLEERNLPRIDFAWGGGAPGDRVPADYFATVATTELELPAGKYRLRTVSDDGVRVSVDGRRIIDNWTWHPPREDTAEIELSSGGHAITMEHFEIDGVAQLQFWIEPQ